MKTLKHKLSFLKQKKNIFCRGAAFINLICNKNTLHIISIATSLSIIEHRSAHAMDPDEPRRETIRITLPHLQFEPLEAGYYTISNNFFTEGLLCYTSKESHDGHYAQVLSGYKYESQREFYQPGERWGRSVVWHITPVEDGYTISNSAFSEALLSYTSKESYNGRYAQILSKSHEDLYQPGGGWRKSVVWHITPVEDGYTIRNSNFSESGFLCYTSELSCDGRYAQILDGPNYDKDLYQPGERWGRSVVWNFVSQ